MIRARDNPFRTDRVLAFRYQPRGWTWNELMNRLAAMRYRGAIVGPHGSGKTTLLEDLDQRLFAAGHQTIHIRLWDQKRALSVSDHAMIDDASGSTIVLVDGAEQFSALRWLRLRFRTRRHRGLIVTQHRAGRMPTIVRTATSPELLGEMIRAMDRELPPDECVALYQWHRGNLRDAIRELYDYRCYA